MWCIKSIIGAHSLDIPLNDWSNATDTDDIDYEASSEPDLFVSTEQIGSTEFGRAAA